MKQYTGKLLSFKFKKGKEILSGLVITYNQDWTLLKYNPVDFVIDGYALLNNSKIEGYKRESDAALIEKVIALKGLEIKDIDQLPFQNLGEILNAIAHKFEIIQVELKSPQVVYIGRIKFIKDDHISLACIKPNGKKGNTMQIPIEDIKLIQFDNDYINSLKLIIDKS